MKRALLLALLLCACSRPKPAPPPAIAMDGASRYAAGKRALEEGKDELAEAHFHAVVDSPPAAGEDPALRSNALLGLASLRKDHGDAKGALAYAQRVVALRPDDEDALQVVIELAHAAGAIPAEIAARQAMVELEPDALDERLALAGALTVAKDDRAKAAFFGYEDTRTRLVMALGKSPDAAMRRAAARALGAAHDAGTARALVLAMTDRDAGVRAEAVRAVGAVGLDLDAEVRPALKKLSTLERDADVKTALREVLAQPAQAK